MPVRLIAAFVFAIAVYLTCAIPAIRTVVTPVEGVDSPQDQVQAMQLLSAGNVIMLGLLGMVIALQVRGRIVFSVLPPRPPADFPRPTDGPRV
jgi:hypothetical protein